MIPACVNCYIMFGGDEFIIPLIGMMVVTIILICDLVFTCS